MLSAFGVDHGISKARRTRGDNATTGALVGGTVTGIPSLASAGAFHAGAHKVIRDVRGRPGLKTHGKLALVSVPAAVAGTAVGAGVGAGIGSAFSGGKKKR